MPNEPYTLDASTARSCACLIATSGAPVPLEGVDIRSEVFGAHARVVLRQRYRNTEKASIEAIYTFPIPSEAALVGFAMECAGRRLEAEVKEREEAFAAYDEAVSAGHGAALLDEERRNVFTASVGNLLPGEETIVEIAYVQALRADEGALRFVVPTVVAPRYIPVGAAGDARVDRTGHGSSDPTARVPDADRISPTVGPVDYGFTLDVLFDLGRAIEVESPSHAIKISAESGDRKRIQLRRAEAPLDRDLVLIASGAADTTAGVVVDRSAAEKRGGTFALTVVPDLFDRDSGRPPSRDVVFLIDTSGSMGGPSIAQAKAALRLCLRQLVEGDRFRIIAFTHQQHIFEAAATPFTQKNLARADAWIDGLAADGGTEMLAPLLRAIEGFDPSGKRDRVIVLLTDGQVGNEAEIVEQVVLRANGARVYTFGIGTAVSDLLIRDLARRTRAAAEFIYPGERIEEKVTAQFARAIAPRVTDLSLVIDGVDADEIAPAELPDLIDAEPWVVYGRYAEPGRGKAKLRGKRDGEAFYLEVTCDLLGEATRPGLAQLWARAHIRDLEEAKVDGRRAEANKKRIVALSIEHSVSSKHASFVVIEKRRGDRLSKGQPEARPVAVRLPGGWGAQSTVGYGPPMAPAMVSPYAAPSRALNVPSPPGFASPPPSPPMGMAPGFAPPPPMAGGYGAPPAPPGFGSPPGFGGPPMQGPPSPPAAAPPQARSLPAGKKPGFLHNIKARLGPATPPAPAAMGAPAAAPPPPAQEAAYRSAASTGSFAAASEAPADRSSSGSTTAIFERQLANGLWGDDADDDATKLLATARALAAAFAEGIDASHAMFGGQIKKAIDAVIAAAATPVSDKKADSAAATALLAAHLVASSKRQRDRILAVVTARGWSAMAPLFATPDAAQKGLAELLA